jgi:hypothetical protein
MTFGYLLLRPLRGIPPIVAGDSLADIALAGLHRSNDRSSIIRLLRSPL